MRRIAWLAVFAGGIAYMILSAAFTIPIVMYVFRHYGLASLPAADQAPGYLAALHGDAGLYALAIFCGCLASLCSGAIAAFVAKRDRVLSGALAAWYCVGLDVWQIATHATADGLVFEVVMMPVAPALSALGGWAVARMRSEPGMGSRKPAV